MVKLLSRSFLIISLTFCSQAREPDVTSSSITQWPLLAQTAQHCIYNKMSRYDISRGPSPVFFSAESIEIPELPSIDPPNSTAGEQWEFDGISEDGTQALVFGFYRDPNYSFFSTGNLRMYAEFSFPNGSRYSVVDYAEESTIEWCPDSGTRGTWRGADWVYTFETTTDMSLTTITVKNPEAQATVVMKSIAPPRYADNSVWPDESGSPLTVPHFFWFEPVPVANLSFSGTINGENIRWEGMGGHERLWSAFNWYTCLNGMTAVRLRTGPFALSLVTFESGRQPGLLVSSVFMASDNTKIFSSRRTQPSDVHDYFQVLNIYGGQGNTTYWLADKVTGIDLTLRSPSREQEWKFTITHKTVGFEYILGGGYDGTAYAGIAKASVNGLTQWQGPAFSEVLKFPQRSLLLRKNFSN